MAKTQSSVFILALIIVRKITSKGAELVGQRLVNASSIPEVSSFFADPFQWRDIFDTVCVNASGLVGISNLYVRPTHKFEHADIANEERVTMIHQICLDGPVADVFRETKNLSAIPVACDELPRGTELLQAMDQFDDPLLSIFTALTAKIRYLDIQAIVPFGSSELDTIKERETMRKRF